MRIFGSTKRKTLGSGAVVASLMLAASVATIGTAHAGVQVGVTGTVDCTNFKGTVPQSVTLTPKKGSPDTDETPGDDVKETYSLRLGGIPKGGTTAKVKVVCVDDDGDTRAYKPANLVPIKKPTTGSITLNLTVQP